MRVPVRIATLSAAKMQHERFFDLVCEGDLRFERFDLLASLLVGRIAKVVEPALADRDHLGVYGKRPIRLDIEHFPTRRERPAVLAKLVRVMKACGSMYRVQTHRGIHPFMIEVEKLYRSFAGIELSTNVYHRHTRTPRAQYYVVKVFLEGREVDVGMGVDAN